MAMQRVMRRPARQPVSYEPSPQDVARVKKFNESLRYIQGYRTTIGIGATVPLTISLNSPGKMMLGVSFISSLRTVDISDVQVSLTVNNNIVLLNLCAANANPLDTQGMIFFPVPQSLQGNDSISASFTNNGAVAVTVLTNIFYVPRKNNNG